MAGNDNDIETKATARLPNLDIDIVHRASPAGDAEQLTITLMATPSFEAFGRLLEANPFQFWLQMTQLAWQPWLAAFGAPQLLPKPPVRRISETPEDS